MTFSFAPGQAFDNQSIGNSGNALLVGRSRSIRPTSGVLALAFDYLTSLLQFDILLQSISTIDDSNQGPNGGPAYTVLLSNGLTLNGGTTPQVSGGYSEGTFSYSGAPIIGAAISFFGGTDLSALPVTDFWGGHSDVRLPETGFVLRPGWRPVGFGDD